METPTVRFPLAGVFLAVAFVLVAAITAPIAPGGAVLAIVGAVYSVVYVVDRLAAGGAR